MENKINDTKLLIYLLNKKDYILVMKKYLFTKSRLITIALSNPFPRMRSMMSGNSF